MPRPLLNTVVCRPVIGNVPRNNETFPARRQILMKMYTLPLLAIFVCAVEESPLLEAVTEIRLMKSQESDKIYRVL
jgi:hypothetical protein